MNGNVKKFLLVGNKYIPKMHLRQPRFTYSACGPLVLVNQRKNTEIKKNMRFKIYLSKQTR